MEFNSFESPDDQVRRTIRWYTEARTLSGQIKNIRNDVIAGAFVGVGSMYYTDDIKDNLLSFGIATLTLIASDIWFNKYIQEKLQRISESHRQRVKRVFGTMREDIPDHVQDEIEAFLKINTDQLI